MNIKPKERRFALVSKSRTFKKIVGDFSLSDKKVLDLGCSYGEYMVHFGPSSIGITANPAEVTIGKERGLDLRFGNVEELAKLNLPNDFDYIWANNLFEHLLSPHAFLMHLKAISKPECTLILGVPVIPYPFSLTGFSKFRGAFSTAHINFFNWRTLKHTVEAAGWVVKDVRPFVSPVSALDRILKPAMPHIYIIATNNSSFSYSADKIQEWRDVEHYKALLDISDKK